MKFNIEIELENKNYCNGCKLLVEKQDLTPFSKNYYCPFYYNYENRDRKNKKIIRPNICKQNDKEK